MEHEIDAWVEQLGECKQLAEADVKRLCDKASPFLLHEDTRSHIQLFRPEKFLWRSLMYNLSDVQ
jgi:hypothetical protein